MVTPTPTPKPKPVGPGQYTPGPVVRPTQTPVATVPALNPNSVSGLNKILSISLGGVTINPQIQYDVLLDIAKSDANILALGRVLDKIGYTTRNSKATILSILADDPIVSVIVKNNQAGGFIGIRDALLRDYTPVNVTTDEPTLPSRTISKVDPEAFGNVISSVFEKVAMKKGNKEQIDALVKEFLPKLEGGTLTEVKKVKNPKTGKLENVTTVTPGMSQETAKISIEEKIKELYPEEVDVASRINFNSWLDKNSRGV